MATTHQNQTGQTENERSSRNMLWGFLAVVVLAVLAYAGYASYRDHEAAMPEYSAASPSGRALNPPATNSGATAPADRVGGTGDVEGR
ncbi:hypothetical protein GC177_08765 [bacterium]|nr:hypothetical protein [bacterium]